MNPSPCDEIRPVPETDGERSRCPLSRTIGPAVDLITLKALLKVEALRRLEGKEYRFCPEPTCEVVYFDRAAGSVFRKKDLEVRVAVKESEESIPVCYCFAYTTADLRRDIVTSGHTGIPATIQAEIRAGHCACEIKNPRGSCCLGDVRSAVTRIRSQLASATGQSKSPGPDDTRKTAY